MPNMSRSDRCINLFKKPGVEGHKGKSLIKVSQTMLEQYPHFSIVMLSSESVDSSIEVDSLNSWKETDT